MKMAFFVLTGIYALIFLMGRAHSRYLDRLEGRREANQRMAQREG